MQMCKHLNKRSNFMKKKALIVTIAALCLTCAFFAGAYAGGALQPISAYLNYGISVAKGGQVQTLTDANGNIVTPITYNDSTYLPVRAISNVLGHSVDWNAQTQCILLDGSPVPTSLMPNYSSTGSVTIQDPATGSVDLGFLSTLMAQVGNGKLTFDDYCIENFTQNGAWVGKAYYSGNKVAYSYYWMDIESDGYDYSPEVAALETAVCNALVANGYKLTKTDTTYNTKHYVKGVSEFTVQNDEYKLEITADTKWLGCCIDSSLYR